MLLADDSAEENSASDSLVQVNEVLLQQLVEMGFSVEGCKRALINTGNNDVEAAMNWVFEHQSDPDFDAPYQAPSKKARMDKPETPAVRHKPFSHASRTYWFLSEFRSMKKVLL